MKNYLLIAEKPSVMRAIQDCYNNHKSEVNSKIGSIEFISLSGHVCTNFEPNDYKEWAGKKWNEVDYPMVPKEWKIKPIDDSRKKDTLKEIKERVKTVDGIIVATDSDNEGYGVYLLVEAYLGLNKIPSLRFIEHSLTDKEILQSLLTMTDYHKDPVHQCAMLSYLVRSRADWLYGMNATRVMTNKTGNLMRIGRVKSPTIMLIYENSKAIENFKPETYWQLSAQYDTFGATLCDDDLKIIKFKDKDKIPSFPLEGTVLSCETKKETTHAPKLFDLTSAQAEAGRLFGYKPDQTLEIIQSLYEKYNVISYPRTQCRFVSSEKAKEFPEMLKNMKAYPELAKYLADIDSETIRTVMSDSKVVNDKEVAKESHDALLPTSVCADPSKMSETENNICRMIYTRLLAQFLPRAEDNKTKAVIQHGDGKFLSNGRMVLNQGWRVLYKEEKDNIIPDLKPGDKITANTIAPVEKTTSPPKRLTQATLINAMQNIASLIEDEDLKKSLSDSKGIGTPATRAAIIAEIISTGYARDSKGGLYITDLGCSYVEALNGFDIIEPEFAAIMDTDIKKVQRGEADYEIVYNETLTKLQEMCDEMGKLPNAREMSVETDIHCPCCNKLLTKKYNLWECSDCGFKIYKTVAGTDLTDDDIQKLVSGQMTDMHEFTSKKKKPFRARLYLDNDHKTAFNFDSGIACPRCGAENVRINNGGMFCDCGLQIFRKQASRHLSDEDLLKIATSGESDVMAMTSKAGKHFRASIILKDDGKTEFKFPSSGGKFGEYKGENS